MPGFPAGTVTFLFSDIEKSTQSWGRDAVAARTVVERHLVIIGGAVQQHGGVHFKTIGDATQSAFATAPQGIAAALEAQRGLSAEAWPNVAERPRVRMALHAGAAEPRDGDYLAACLNRLSRLLDSAHGEQVLLSATVASLAGDSLPEGATLAALGEFRLRDILQPEEVFQLRHPELRAEFPPLNSPGHLPHNLPAHPTPFLGREREIEEILTLLLRPDVRLVTLTGPGGVGKTRLGFRVAAEALEAFPDGVFAIDLARQTDPALVPAATAAALGLREQPGQTLPQMLTDYLRERRMLLLFDNFEHVLPAATLAAELLAVALELKILATSRAPLEVQAEYEYKVETLPVPDPARLPPLAELASYDAVALFVARVQALRPGFTLTERNAATVVAICARVDGLPLAIELAAARVRLLSPEALLERLDRRLVTLTGGARDLPARQQTLRGTIAWSHDLLAAAEQILFRRLSVFVGGWTLEGAEAIAGTEGVEAVDALEGLSGLLDQSLVAERPHRESGSDEPRYGMLETIREFAAEQLAGSGEAAPVEHAFEHFLMRRAETADAALRGPDQEVWLRRVEAEHDNLRAALGRAISRADGAAALALATRLRRFWWMHGSFGEGRSWLERALALGAADPALMAHAEYGIGDLAAISGDYRVADTHLQTSIALRRQLGDLPAMAEALSVRANVAVNLRDYDRARALGEEALTIFREHGDARQIAGALYDLGVIAREQGDVARARRFLEESLAAWRGLDDLIWTATVALGLAVAHRLAGNIAEARPLLDDAAGMYRRLDDRFGLATIAWENGHIAREAGDLERAIARYGEALRYFVAINHQEAVVYSLEYLAACAARQDDAALALRLFGAATAAREALQLPPPGQSDERIVAEGRALAMRAAGEEADRHLAAGQTLTLDQARDAAYQLVDHVNAAAPVEGAANA